MRLLKFFEATRLDELRQRYVDPDASGNRVVVAHRGNVWILNDGEVPAQVVADILQQTGAGNPGDIAGETVNVWDIQQMLEERPDVIFGQWSGDDFYMSDRATGSLDPRSSPLYRQLAQHLGISTATRSATTWTGDETEQTVWQHEMQGKLPDVMYHGTHTGVLSSILKTGLNPDSYESNWPTVGKFDLIFFTTKFEEAAFQANRSADMKNTQPVVLQVRIPDKDQVTWDYDMAALYANPEENPDLDTHGFTASPEFFQQSERGSAQGVQAANPGTNYMTATGTVGYKKRIPAKFIVGANVADAWGAGDMGMDEEGSPIEHDNNYMTMDELKASMERIDDYGYDPGEDYEPEEDEDEEDF